MASPTPTRSTPSELRELAHSGQLSAAVLAALPGTAVFVYDLDLRYVLAAGQALERHGHDGSEIEGRTLQEVLSPERCAELEPHYRAALAGEVARFDIRSADGRAIYRTDVAPIRQGGEVVGGIVIARDVTEARHREQALLEANERFEAAFRDAPIGKAIVALDGMWLKVNRALCEITGYPEDELIGMTFQELSHPDDAAADLEEVGRLLAGEIRSYRVEKRYVRADGEINWVALNGSLVRDSECRPLYLIAQVEDIGDRKRAERERDRLDQLKDEFVSFVSHELRTPLTSILGYVELLISYGDDLSDEQHHFLATVQRNGERLNRLIEDLLAYFRVAGGEVEMRHDPLDMAALLTESVESAGPAAVRKQLALSSRFVDSAPVVGDEGRLAQVLDNLLSNAIKYTPEGGEIEAALRIDGGHVVLEVADTGIGIPAAERERLFERFFRASTATERAIPGTGLGLAITKALVEAHGGTIAAEPRDQGTLFRVTLPLAERPALAAGA